MFKKRFLAVITVICLVCSLCSCGGDKVNYLTLFKSMNNIKNSEISGMLTVRGEVVQTDLIGDSDSISISYNGVKDDKNYDLTGSLMFGDTSTDGHIILSNDVLYVSKETCINFMKSVKSTVSDDESAELFDAMSLMFENVKEDYLSENMTFNSISYFTDKDFNKLANASDNFLKILGKKAGVLSKSNGWYTFELNLTDDDLNAVKKKFTSRYKQMLPATIELYYALSDIVGKSEYDFKDIADELSSIQNDKEALKAKIAEWKENGVTELDALNSLKDYKITSSIKKDNSGYSFMLSMTYTHPDEGDIFIEYEGTIKATDKKVKAPDSVKPMYNLDLFNTDSTSNDNKNSETGADTPAIDIPESMEKREISITEQPIGKTPILAELDKVLNKSEIDKVMSNIVNNLSGDWEDDFETSAEGYTTKSMTRSVGDIDHTIKLSISTMGYNDFDYSVSADEVKSFDKCFKSLCDYSKVIAGVDISESEDVKRAVSKVQAGGDTDSYVEIRVDKQRLCTIYLDVEKDSGIYLAFTYEYSYE